MHPMFLKIKCRTKELKILKRHVEEWVRVCVNFMETYMYNVYDIIYTICYTPLQVSYAGSLPNSSYSVVNGLRLRVQETCLDNRKTRADIQNYFIQPFVFFKSSSCFSLSVFLSSPWYIVTLHYPTVCMRKGFSFKCDTLTLFRASILPSVVPWTCDPRRWKPIDVGGL